MAAQNNTWTGAVNNNYNNAGNWDTFIEADRVPTSLDRVIFNNAVDCTMDAATAADLGSWTMTGYTGTLTTASGNDIDVIGAVILDGTIAGDGDWYCAGAFTKTASMTALPATVNIILDGTGNVTCNSVTGGNLDINTAATHTAADAAYWDSFTLTGGTYVDGGLAHTTAGNTLIDGGTFTTTSNWIMSVSGNYHNETPNGIYELTVNNGVTCTIITNVGRVRKLSGEGTVAGEAIYFRLPRDNFWNFGSGTCSTSVYCYETATPMSTGSAITCAGDFSPYRQALTLDGDITATGDVDIGYGSNNVTLDTNANNITCTNIQKITTGTANLDLSTAIITISGTFNGTGLTIVGEASGTGNHAEVHGGTVSNVSMPLDDEALDCTDNVTNGGSNTNVWFSGCNGGHQILGGGFIGSAKAT